MNRSVGARLALACSLVVQAGCSALVGADFGNVHARVDAGDDGAAEAPDVADAMDASEGGDETGSTIDAPSTADVAPDATDATDATDSAAADASGDADASSDADTDAILCGATRCNGTCENGRCLETLVTGQQGVSGVAADDAYVYWSNYETGAVMRAPLGAAALSAQPTVLASGQEGPEGTAVVGGTIYWANWADGTVQSTSATPAPGTPAASTPLIDGQTNPTAITTDAAFIYWANYNGNGSILQAPLGGPSSQAAAVVLVQGDTGNPNCLAVNSKYVYWIDWTGSVKATPLDATIDDSQATIIYTVTAQGAHGLAVDDTFLYWADPGPDTSNPTGMIWRVPLANLKPGVPATQIAGGQENPNALFVDAKYIYWGNIGTGEIMRTAK